MSSRNHSPLTTEELDVLMRNDFATFVQVMFNEVSPGVHLIWARYLDLVCALLADVAHGRRRHLIITIPPRHLKSFCVSTCLPAFVLGHYPSQEVLCVSYGQELSLKFAQDFLTILGSESYVRAFGHLPVRKRQPAHLIRVKGGGARRATSLDGTATGVGGDLMIFDDPQKPNETLSEAVRRSTNEAYEQTFLSRRNDPKTARIIIVMQRLHEDDFANHVLSLGGDWDVVNLPAIAEGDEVIPYKTFLGQHYFRRFEGEALHPIRMPVEELAKVRAASGEAVWATQYQQRPAPAGGGFVKTKWFGRYRPGELPEQFDRIVQSWDTANKTNEWNDYSVCTTWGLKGKRIYLLHVYRQRVEFPELTQAVFEQARVWDPDEVFIEDQASGTQLLQYLREANFGKARGVKPSRDKETRMINQTATIKNGLVLVPEEAPWLADYLHELAVFPNGRYFDQIDSTSQALAEINNWLDGRGMLAFIRQDMEQRRAKEEEILILRGPPECNMVHDMQGHSHRQQPDGTFHLTAAQAGRLPFTMGWTRVNTP